MKALIAALIFSGTAIAQQGTTAAQAANADTSYIAPDGTAHITRVVPVPPDLSPEAKAMLARPASDAAVPESIEQRRANIDTWQAHAGEVSRKAYPVNVEEQKIAGVPVRVVTPLATPEGKRDRVLLNLHGGGFNADSGSLTESIPIANLTQMKVVAVLYRLAPEHPFPAGLDDAVAVYKELLKSYRPEHIAIYGTSAGAVMTGEMAVKLRQLELPEPAALGIFSGVGDLGRDGDSIAIFTGSGLSGHMEPPVANPPNVYAGSTDRRDPVLSPLFADLHKMPPSLFISSERDMLLSGTTILHRAFQRAGNDAELVVFEGLPHAFWNDVSLPETKEAYGDMSDFFLKHLK
jgi:epsilon-lactone hydrolase